MQTFLCIHFDTVTVMNYSVAIRREITVLKIEESTFDYSHNEAFNAIVEDLLAKEESKNLIIDFSDIKTVDPAVIIAIRFAQEFANRNGGVVIFVALCKPIKELLTFQQLDKQLYMYSSIHEVLTLIAPDVKGRKQVRRKKTVHPDDLIDELLKLEVKAIPKIPADLIDEIDDEVEETDENPDTPLDESDELAPPAKPSPKKGRPTKK